MSKPPDRGEGLFGSLRRLGHTAVSVAEVRLELFGTELEQEKLRVAGALLLGAVGLVLIGAALLLLTGFVILLLQDAYRLPAMGVLGSVYALAGWWVLRRARGRLRSADGGPFALSLGELRRDRDGLVPPGE